MNLLWTATHSNAIPRLRVAVVLAANCRGLNVLFLGKESQGCRRLLSHVACCSLSRRGAVALATAASAQPRGPHSVGWSPLITGLDLGDDASRRLLKLSAVSARSSFHASIRRNSSSSSSYVGGIMNVFDMKGSALSKQSANDHTSNSGAKGYATNGSSNGHHAANSTNGHAKTNKASSSWSLTPSKLHLVSPVPSDIEVVRAHKCKRVDLLASEMGLSTDEFEPYGHYKGKITRKAPVDAGSSSSRGTYIVVTGINPTPLGEGKSTTVIGMAQCLGATLGKNAIACIRQPSQGPTFGIKGGAAGGGYSQVIPMEDFNLHLTGDIHAITAANNLIAAAIDARAFHEATQSDTALFSRLVPAKREGKRSFIASQKKRLEKLGIPSDLQPDDLTLEQRCDFSRLNFDFNTLNWNRVVDINDRFLRKMTIGQGKTEKGFSRETQYDISVASELMAILSLCSGVADARERIGRIVVCQSKDADPKAITCEDLGIAGAVMVLLKDALKPNLVQTLEGTPVLVHCGPFANIAHGNSSVIADKLALEMVGKAGYVLTEAGFGADVGLEKFVHIKSATSGIMPDCVVIVATVRALKTHGGGPQVTPGARLPKEYTEENLELLSAGMSNLRRHIENVTQKFMLPLVVAINRFSTDSDKEIEMIKAESLAAGADAACLTNHFELGGPGALELSQAVVDICARPKKDKTGRYLYDTSNSIKEKIEAVVRDVYGGDGVNYSDIAEEKIKQYETLGYGKFPVCIAKTQYSFSHDPALKGAPTGFTFPIIDVRVSVGAGFVYPLAGEIQTMPGLPTRPAYFDIDIDPVTEVIEGLF